MDTLTNGLSQGDFTLLRVLHNGDMTDILTLIGTLGGGPITPVQLPLSINGGVLSVDLSGHMATTHEANNIGNSNVAFGTYDINTRTLTLENSSGVTAQISMDLGGNLNLNGSVGIVTIVVLNAWSPLALKLADSGGTVRNITAS